MKVLHVGGRHLVNRFSNLAAAMERAQDDDTIELHKDVEDVALYVAKNITIIGHGHHISPKSGKTAFDCAAFVTMEDIMFDVKPRTNAVILRDGGRLSRIRTRIIGPARALYPTVVQKGGALDMEDCTIMGMYTYPGHQKKTQTAMHKCTIEDYYGGYAWLDNEDGTLSHFQGVTDMHGCIIACTLLDGECHLVDTTLRNFNKALGTVILTACKLEAARGSIVKCPGEPIDGPLKDLKTDVVPYALHVAGGKVVADSFSSASGRDCIGFYMTAGFLDIRNTHSTDMQARHLIKGGSVVFNGVTDEGVYEIKSARCGIIRSQVNTSCSTKPALEQLDAMIGLSSVKRQVRTILNTVSMNRKHPEKDFGFSHHMVFAGDPGTGKTTVAKLVAQALFEVGAIPENRCMEVPASQMVKGYVGQTGAHVESILQKALGGVLFIDEAYELTVRDGQNTFNNDVLSVLLRYMEDHRDELVVIVAGYEKEMREFLASNVGLARRFQWVSFQDYTPEEMAGIFLSMCRQYKETFGLENPGTVLVDCFRRLTGYYLSHPDAKGRTTNGGNGGLVRNLFQQIVFARNNRVAEYPISAMDITEADIRCGLNNELKKAVNIMHGTASIK